MKRVLIISYYFPPAGGSGVHRPWAMTRHLPGFGWQPTVLTAGEQWYGGTAGRSEEALSVDCRVVRTPSSGTASLFPLWKRGASASSAFARVCEPRALWAVDALRTATRLLAREQFHAILVTAPPYALAPLGRLLRLRSGVPTVLDMRDPWAFGISQPWYGYMGWLADAMLQEWAFAGSDRIVTNTPTAYAMLARRNPALARQKATWIPNGFREDVPRDSKQEHDGKLHLLHAGVFYGDYGKGDPSFIRRMKRWLSYDPGEVDRSPQSVRFLLEALRQAVSREPSLRDDLDVTLLGKLSARDRALVAEHDLESVVNAPGHVPVREAIRAMSDADLLYLPFWVSRTGKRIPRVPSKLYEYMATGRRTLGVLAEGDTRDILSGAGTGLLCDEASVEELANKLLLAYKLRREGQLQVAPDREYVKRFGWRALTGRIATVLDAAAREG